VKINSDEQNTILAHELQSALSLTVGFCTFFFFVNCNKFVT